MKRILSLLVCSLLLCGCTKMPEGQITQTVSTKPTASIPEDTTIIDFGPSVVLSNYKEYLDYIEDDPVLPVNFIYHEQIASLGQFVRYECESWSKKPSNTAQFTYTLGDTRGRTFCLTVYRHTLENNYIEAEGVIPENLLFISRGDVNYRTFFADDLEYTYNRKGNLFNIYWEVDGYGVSLRPEGGFDQFAPNPDGTFVERLLCLESAPAAVEDFAQMISTPYTPEGEVVP